MLRRGVDFVHNFWTTVDLPSDVGHGIQTTYILLYCAREAVTIIFLFFESRDGTHTPDWEARLDDDSDA